MSKKTPHKNTPIVKSLKSKIGDKAATPTILTSAETKARPQITVVKAKGRPMLSWVGKRPLKNVTCFPAQFIERYSARHESPISLQDDSNWADWPSQYTRSGLLFHGDNKDVLAHLLGNGFRGSAQLIYIDPPFDSGADYVRRVTLRGPTGTTKLEGETYSLGEQIQYTDIWANDNYLQFMYERLLLMRSLLKLIFNSTNIQAIECA